jgi:hypothetical protein
MDFELSIRISSVVFSFNGKRSLYVSVVIGRTRYWVQRWDNDRAPKNKFRNGDMGWSWGVARPEKAKKVDLLKTPYCAS